VIDSVKINTLSRYLRENTDESADEPESDAFEKNHSSNEDVTSSEDKFPIENTTATVEFNDLNRAIALISFGEAASESTLLERCILSIRRRGKFNGQVIVITDAPEDRYDSEFDRNVTVLQAKEDDIRYGYYVDDGMKYKRFKTLVIDYMNTVPELDNIDWLYYLDIDMMIGAPFIDFVKELHDRYNIDNDSDATPSLHMFQDPHGSKFKVNSGFIIINRHTSNRCLEAWRDEIDEHPDFKFDQLTLNEIKRDEEKHNCKLVGMHRDKYVTFPAGDGALEKMIRDKDYSPLIHIFNSCFAKRMDPKLMYRFVCYVLELSKEERQEHKFGKAVIVANKKKWSAANNTAQE